MEYRTTGASWPWNLSTVPTRAPSGRSRRISATWLLYGATTRTSSTPIGRSTPLGVDPADALQRAPQLGDRGGLLVRRRRRRARVLDEADGRPAGPPIHSDPLPALRRLQPPLVGEVGHERGQCRVHAVGQVE